VSYEDVRAEAHHAFQPTLDGQPLDEQMRKNYIRETMLPWSFLSLRASWRTSLHPQYSPSCKYDDL